jgi:hypothetical protein
MKSVNQTPQSEYDQITKGNERQFERVLEELSPGFFYLYTCIKANDVDLKYAIDVFHKMKLVRKLDDGYGAVIIEVKNHEIGRIRLVADYLPKRDNVLMPGQQATES